MTCWMLRELPFLADSAISHRVSPLLTLYAFPCTCTALARRAPVVAPAVPVVGVLTVVTA